MPRGREGNAAHWFYSRRGTFVKVLLTDAFQEDGMISPVSLKHSSVHTFCPWVTSLSSLQEYSSTLRVLFQPSRPKLYVLSAFNDVVSSFPLVVAFVVSSQNYFLSIENDLIVT